MGRAAPSTRLAILDSELRPVPPGRSGQIATAGAHVMMRYTSSHFGFVAAARLADEGGANSNPQAKPSPQPQPQPQHPTPTGSYWAQPRLTDTTLVRGWLLTGDVGLLGVGVGGSAATELHYLGRIKEVAPGGGHLD